MLQTVAKTLNYSEKLIQSAKLSFDDMLCDAVHHSVQAACEFNQQLKKINHWIQVKLPCVREIPVSLVYRGIPLNTQLLVQRPLSIDGVMSVAPINSGSPLALLNRTVEGPTGRISQDHPNSCRSVANTNYVAAVSTDAIGSGVPIADRIAQLPIYDRQHSCSEQTQLRKEAHGHRGALRKAIAALFHHRRARSLGTGGWSMAVQPGTVHDPSEATLVFDRVGQRLDKRLHQLSNTVIVGAGGNRYHLLNSLTPGQEKLLASVLDGCEPEVEEFLAGRLKVVLGKGAYGSVRLALNEKTQQLVVVKKMQPEFGLEEVKKFKMLDSLPAAARSAVINLEDYAVVPGKNGQLKAYLFEELMNHGDLGDYDNAAVLDLPNTQPERLDLALHILELVQRIHDHHTYHRDLKPDNLLRTMEGTIKLGDVGFMSQELYPMDVGGTLPFMPPEVGQPQARADLADAFAIGVMFYQLLGRVHPAEDYPQVISKAPKGEPADNQHLSEHKSFIAACDMARDRNEKGDCTLATVAYQLLHPIPEHRLTVPAAREIIANIIETGPS